MSGMFGRGEKTNIILFAVIFLQAFSRFLCLAKVGEFLFCFYTVSNAKRVRSF